MRSWDISYSPGGKPAFWTIILRTQFLFANLFVSWFSMQFESDFLLVFLKMKVIYFLSFSVIDLVLENTEFSKKKKKGNFPLGWCVRLAVEALLGSVMNDPGSSHVTWASAANRWPGPSACGSLWHIWPPASRNSSLTLSLLAVFHPIFVSPGPRESSKDMIPGAILSSERSAGTHTGFVCFAEF